MIQTAEVLRSSQERFCTTLSKFVAAKIARNTHRLRESAQETRRLEKSKQKTPPNTYTSLLPRKLV